MFFWHYYKLRKKWDRYANPGMSRADIMKDEGLILFLPLIILIIGQTRSVDVVDVFQAVIPTLVLIFWRKMLFR